MTRCPDWRRLAADADAFLVEGSQQRRTVLEHAADCPACRRAALVLDPSLAVSGLPPIEVPRSEVESIKRDVLNLRRMRRLERTARPRRRRRLVAAAVLTAGILFVAEDDGRRRPGEGPPPPAAASPLLLSEDYRLYGSLPLVESLEPSEPRVYQLGEESFSLVWIVDESLDISPPNR